MEMMSPSAQHRSYLYYLKTERELPRPVWAALLKKVPRSQQEAVQRFHRWQDRQLGLFGKLLLQYGLARLGFSPGLLESIRYTDHGRPFLHEGPDFNLSHSGNLVVCALSMNMRVGVDVEQVRSVDLTDFSSTMNARQWAAIHGAPDPVRMFYHYWVIKESVIKAIGKGMSLPLQEIEQDNGCAWIGTEKWFIRKLDVDREYQACMATDRADFELHAEAVRWEDLLG